MFAVLAPFSTVLSHKCGDILRGIGEDTVTKVLEYRLGTKSDFRILARARAPQCCFGRATGLPQESSRTLSNIKVAGT
jgi:hypothetical protein